MRALVTGGAGFIGSNLVDALLERGDEVTVVDDLSTGKRENLEGALANGAELVEARHPRRRRDASRSAERAQPDAIFHLAAQIDVRQSAADPAFDARVNVGGTINMLEAARASRRRSGSSTPRPAARSTARARSSPRPRTTRSCPRRRTACPSSAPSTTARSSAACTGVPTVSLRYGNVYGPRQDPLGEAGVIAIFCGKLLEGETADDLRRRQADARLRLRRRRRRARTSRRSSTPTRRGAFNVGTGQADDVLEIVDALARDRRRDFEPEFAPRAQGRGAAHRARRPRARARSSAGRRGRARRGPRADARLAALAQRPLATVVAIRMETRALHRRRRCSSRACSWRYARSAGPRALRRPCAHRRRRGRRAHLGLGRRVLALAAARPLSALGTFTPQIAAILGQSIWPLDGYNWRRRWAPSRRPPLFPSEPPSNIASPFNRKGHSESVRGERAMPPTQSTTDRRTGTAQPGSVRADCDRTPLHRAPASIRSTRSSGSSATRIGTRESAFEQRGRRVPRRPGRRTRRTSSRRSTSAGRSARPSASPPSSR